VSAEDVRAIAEEALSEHDGWYRFRDRRRRTDEIHALARAYLEAEARLARLERIEEWLTRMPAEFYDSESPLWKGWALQSRALAATEEGAEG